MKASTAWVAASSQATGGTADVERELEQTLALAGVVQCAAMTVQLAHHGMAPAERFATALESLFVTHPRHAEDVFAGIGSLRLGLETLRELLSGNRSGSSGEVLRYVLNLLHLQGRLAQRRDLLNRIAEGLEQINRQGYEQPYSANPQVIRQLAKLYQDTLSTLPFRIQVRGDMQRLQNELVAARIRVLLFAGVRAAVLWEQRGGRRWHLLFSRKRLARHCETLLRQCKGD